MNVWLTSDHHFGHANLLTFQDRDGAYFRGNRFSSIEEMDEYMVARWNSLVKPDDKVYHLGDFAMGLKRHSLDIANRLNGRKVLIRGNHDKLKLSQYAEHFKDVRATHMLSTGVGSPCSHLVLSHVPIHPRSLGAGWVNVHGHTHEKGSPPGPYVSVCVEMTDYLPLRLDSVTALAHLAAGQRDWMD